MGRQVNASSEPTRAVTECEMTDVHVHDGDMGIVGMKDQTDPSRPKAIGRGVHLGFQRLGRISFNLAEIHATSLPDLASRQNPCSSSPASRTLPSIFLKGRTTTFGLLGLKPSTNAVLQRLQIGRQRGQSIAIHGRGAVLIASGYASGNKCW